MAAVGRLPQPTAPTLAPGYRNPGRVHGGVQAHPHPLRDQLNPEQNNPTLNLNLNPIDSESRTRQRRRGWSGQPSYEAPGQRWLRQRLATTQNGPQRAAY